MNVRNWNYIDAYKNELPNTEFVHCDTRDFYVMCNNIVNEEQELNKDKKIVLELYDRMPAFDKEKCKINRSEILNLLKGIETKTGGTGTWRCLRLNTVNSGWVKYIRFIHIDDDTYLCYTNSCCEHTILYKDDLLADNVNDDEITLNFLKE